MDEMDEQTRFFLEGAMLEGPEHETNGITGVNQIAEALYVLYEGVVYFVRLRDDMSIGVVRVDGLYDETFLSYAEEGTPEHVVRSHLECVYEAGAIKWLGDVFRIGGSAHLPANLSKLTLQMLSDGRIRA